MRTAITKCVLSYYRARYYDPQIGRFISEDSWGFRAGNDFYAYVSNNAVNRVDPMGLQDTAVNMPAMRDGILQRALYLNLEQVCGSDTGGACTILKAALLVCNCECDGKGWKAYPELRLYGTLYYFNGRFPYRGKKPNDSSVVDAGTAIAHEYNYHINPSIAAVTPLIDALKARTFQSKQECDGQCDATSAVVGPLFRDTLRATQARENNQ